MRGACPYHNLPISVYPGRRGCLPRGVLLAIARLVSELPTDVAHTLFARLLGSALLATSSTGSATTTATSSATASGTAAFLRLPRQLSELASNTVGTHNANACACLLHARP